MNRHGGENNNGAQRCVQGRARLCRQGDHLDALPCEDGGLVVQLLVSVRTTVSTYPCEHPLLVLIEGQDR